MHIIYIHQHFCTNEGSSGTRSYDVSRHLAAMGHRVTVICGVLDMGGFRKGPWYRPFSRHRMEGFDVIVCNVLYSNYQGTLTRMLSFVFFALLATVAALQVRRPDLVLATSLPLTVGIPGYVASRLRRIPFVFEVRDICPEGDVLCGYLKKGSPVERALSFLENFMYRQADRILLVSPGFQNRLVERGYDATKMRTILLGADGLLFEDVEPSRELREQAGLTGKMIAVYTGAHGTANGLDYILDAARCIKHRSDIAFVLIGDGREKPRLIRRAEAEGLDNVHFWDFVPKSELPGILCNCDIGLMILRDIGQARPVTPNKIFDYMFAGMPSIVNFCGPTREMVEADGTGAYADPTRPESLAEQVVTWSQQPEEAKRIGRHARAVAFERYDRRRIAEQLMSVFEETIVNRKRTWSE